MFVPWPLQPDAAYRYVIVGAGPAGLYLARKLASEGRVLVIEAGSVSNPHDDGGDFYRLNITGRDYGPLGTRLSGFGGSSNHWGGKCYPLSAEVFAPREGFGEWPIPHEELAAEIPAAADFLNLAPFAEPAASSLNTGVLEGYAELDVTPFENSDPVLRLGEPAHVATYGADPDIDILTETRVVDLDLASSSMAIGSVTLRHRPSGERVVLSVATLILCAGGIENARLMLWAARKLSAGNPLLGGANRLTGTRFLEKTYFSPVDIFLDARADLSDAGANHSAQRHAWIPSPAFRAAHGLPRFSVFADHVDPLDAPDPDLLTANRYFVGDPAAFVHVEPHFQFEYTPRADSYVGLGDQLDPDGVAESVLHWQIDPGDFAAFRRAVLLFCGLLNQRGLARARLRPGYSDEDWSGANLGYCNHHVGTTKMASTAADGVVDPNGQVWGIANLYVAGSSIFPNSDCINPTLTIVALAGRLAAHLKGLAR